MLDDIHDARIVNFTCIRYHTWWPSYSDPFWRADSTESRTRIMYYGGSLYTPHLFIDGIIDAEHITGNWDGLIEGREPVDSPLTIFLAITYDDVTRDGHLTATVTNVSGESKTGRFQMAITESGLTYGGYEQNQVMRDMVPDATGELITLGPSEATDVERDFHISSAWVEENCQIVTFVQALDKEILQGARAFFPVDEPYIVMSAGEASEQMRGDGDGYLDPGETGQVVVTLANINVGEGLGITGTMWSDDPYVRVIDGSSFFGDLPPYGESDNSGDPFVVEILPDCPSGRSVSCSLQVETGAVAYTSTLEFGFGVGSPEDHIGPDPYGYYVYEDGEPYTEAPVFQWMEIDSTKGGPGHKITLLDDYTWRLPLPFTFRYYGVDYDTVTVSSNGVVSMGKNYDNDNSPSHIPDDDGPAAMVAGMWCDLNPNALGSGLVYYYYSAFQHRYIVEYSGVEHFDDGDQGLPETFQIVLYDPAFNPTTTGDGEIVVLYSRVSQPEVCGAGIENAAETIGTEYSYLGTRNPAASGIADRRAVKYTTDPPQRTSVERPLPSGVGPVALLGASPNPFHHGTEIGYRLPEKAEVSLRVYSVDGRLIRTLLEGESEAGTHAVHWDGLSDTGRPVATGIYFSRFEVGAERDSQKLLVVR